MVRARALNMRRLLALGSASILLTCVACSGASSDSVTDDVPAAPEVNATTDPTDPAAKPPVPSSTPPTPPTPPTPSTPDAGPIDGGGAGDGGGPNLFCLGGAFAEIEANDSAQSANALPGATNGVCGSLSAATDVDFFSFVLPANAKSLGFGTVYSKNGIVFEATVSGEKFLLGTAPIFKPGQTYVVRVSTTGKGSTSYRFLIDIKR